jgi:RTX calcium-binding nonapeptide repeat (4 copies)
VRAVLLACALALVAASTAAAGTVSGRIVYCDTGDECRYFGDPRLDVTYRAEPGQRDEVRVLPHPDGVRIVDVHGITAGPFCLAVNENDARCGPPAPEGLLMIARTGDRADVGFAHIGSLILGSGDDGGVVYAASVYGGPGDDELRGFGNGALIVGGPGDDEEIATFGDQLMEGGPGDDFMVAGVGNDRVDGGRGRDSISGGHGRDELVGGPGDDAIGASDHDRDVVRCGSGHDRAYVSRNDRVSGCEIVTLGWPG